MQYFKAVKSAKAHVVLVDHYDSFTFNLVQQFCLLGAQVTVVTHDQIEITELLALDATHYVLSPGPGSPTRPQDFSVSKALLTHLPQGRPLLGVCLGMQGIASFFGGHVTRAPKVMHGKVSTIMHDQSGIFAGLRMPTQVMRYHSLCVVTSSLPDVLVPTAWSPEDGVLMGIRHRTRPIFGVQFHPESVGTTEGDSLIDRFLDIPSTHYASEFPCS